jgi:hypothetical protein
VVEGRKGKSKIIEKKQSSQTECLAIVREKGEGESRERRGKTPLAVAVFNPWQTYIRCFIFLFFSLFFLPSLQLAGCMRTVESQRKKSCPSLEGGDEKDPGGPWRTLRLPVPCSVSRRRCLEKHIKSRICEYCNSVDYQNTVSDKVIR